jgi:hypothetical protein
MCFVEAVPPCIHGWLAPAVALPSAAVLLRNAATAQDARVPVSSTRPPRGSSPEPAHPLSLPAPVPTPGLLLDAQLRRRGFESRLEILL